MNIKDDIHSKVTAPPLTGRAGRESVCSIGFFDGVHRGHQFLIQQVLGEARRRGARSFLVTFDRHPRSLFSPASAPLLLTSHAEKMELLQRTGVDDIFVLPFDHEMASLTAREFMDKELRQQLGVTTLVIGYDHHFGHPQGETFEDYVALGRELDIDVVAASELEGEHVSSSAIRRALASGNVSLAAQMLGRPYTWTGSVVHGHAVGRQLGFPTANLEATEPQKLLPASGVYAVTITSSSAGSEAAAMLNIGHRPTLDSSGALSVEAHLFDFSGDLYGSRLTLSFIARLREEQHFKSEAELRSQLLNDKEETIARLKDFTSYSALAGSTLNR